MQKPDIHAWAKVVTNYCPHFTIHDGHRGRVLGEPQINQGEWVVPVRYNCIGIHHANFPCDELTKLRSIKVKLSKPAIVTGIVLILLLFLGMTFVGNYNSLVTSRNGVDNSWAKVETQYQRRYDLIGNLVESVKGAQGQELKVFTAIADGRKQYASATSPDQQAAAATKIETNLALVPRLQEAYPDLKSNTQVTMLMSQLTGTEDTILAVRNTYNDTVNTYNNSIETFPKSMFANIFGYQPRHLFKADKAAADAPKVKF